MIKQMYHSRVCMYVYNSAHAYKEVEQAQAM